MLILERISLVFSVALAANTLTVLWLAFIKRLLLKGIIFRFLPLIFSRLSIVFYTVRLFILFIVMALTFRRFFFLSSGMINLRIKTNGTLSSFIVPFRQNVRQDEVLPPSIFIFCIFSILENISSMCFVGLTDISYLAYANYILLISRSKLRLSHMVNKVSYSFLKSVFRLTLVDVSISL